MFDLGFIYKRKSVPDSSNRRPRSREKLLFEKICSKSILFTIKNEEF